MALDPYELYIDGVKFPPNAYVGPMSGTYTVTSTGITFTDGGTWTYSGSETFVGFSNISGATTPVSDMEVGDSGYISTIYAEYKSGSYTGSPLYLYSVAVTPSTPVEISYNNTTVASLSIPGSYAYFGTSGDWIQHDIIIKCDPISPNQVIVSTYNYDDEEIDTVYTATSEGTLTLDTEEAWTPYNIKVFYGEPAATIFTIDGVTYNVDENTYYWYEWAVSSYAPSGSSIEFDSINQRYYVHLGGTASNYGIYYNGSLQSPGDEIVVGRAYTTGAAYEIHDLTGTTWLFDNYPSYPFDYFAGTYSINFSSNGGTWTTMSISDYEIDYSNPMAGTMAYGPQSGPPAWTHQNYRTISISGGADATNAMLYAFISSNATQQ